MYFSTLNEWLTWITQLHHIDIELGLDRVKKVADRLDILTFPCKIICVAGTNGKGSTVAGLEIIYLEAGYKVGSFTSPFLFKYNEQVKINGKEINDQFFCDTFKKINLHRGDISLTPFEFTTLAALSIFKQHKLDLILLEVGLGGRLDAVNILDTDISIVTNIGIDHTEWLGSTRETIAFEKAGIFRANKTAICGDFSPPPTLIQQANQLAAPLFCQGKEFYYQEIENQWSWHYAKIHYEYLPKTTLALQNMSTVLMAVSLLQPLLPIEDKIIYRALKKVYLPGRIQVIPGKITKIFDVSHNPDAVNFLSQFLKKNPILGKTYAVFSMLADKDIMASIETINQQIHHWFVAPLLTKRAASTELLRKIFQHTTIVKVSFFPSIKEAYLEACSIARPIDRVVIFGSFHTVAEARIVD